jgi:hypothetical protein
MGRLGVLAAGLVLASTAGLTTAPGWAEPQTSDGVNGQRALPLPRAFRTEDTWTTLVSYAVSPGVSFEQFTLSGVRGVVRGQLVRIDPATPGVALDVVAGRKVAERQPVAEVVDADAVVAVNGDFFDIRDTEAPLGVARDRERGVLNGVESGWNSAFWIDRAGVPHLSDVYADAVLRQRPGLDVSTVNSPSVRPGGIGLYTRAWGKLRSYRVTDGQRRGVRMVIVNGGRVTANQRTFPRRLGVRDLVLVGRGRGAGELARIRVGERLSADVSLSEDAAVVLTGNTYILRDGVRISRDDVDLHPRTAIGLDRDTGQLLLVVVDGRQDFSRGLTMKEMAQLFQRLGAEDALNLDGGGSSIMLVRQPDQSLAVANSPSDGHPRPVANGLEVTYTAPPAG